MEKKFKLVLKFLCFGVFFITGHIYANEIKKEFDAKNLKSLEFSNIGEGDVKIVTSKDSSKIIVKAVELSSQVKCIPEMKRDGSTLKIMTEPHANCRIIFFIETPQHFNVQAEIGYGNISIEGIIRELNFTIGKGDFLVKNSEISKLKGKIGSGNADISAIIKDSLHTSIGNGNHQLLCIFEGDEIDVTTGKGDIDLFLSKIKEKGKVSTKVGSGNSTIVLPADAKIVTNLETGFGKKQTDIIPTPGSLFKIAMTSGTGDLRIKMK